MATASREHSYNGHDTTSKMCLRSRSFIHSCVPHLPRIHRIPPPFLISIVLTLYSHHQFVVRPKPSLPNAFINADAAAPPPNPTYADGRTVPATAPASITFFRTPPWQKRICCSQPPLKTLFRRPRVLASTSHRARLGLCGSGSSSARPGTDTLRTRRRLVVIIGLTCG